MGSIKERGGEWREEEGRGQQGREKTGGEGKRGEGCEKKRRGREIKWKKEKETRREWRRK